MLPQELNISEARRFLPSLVHELERHPDYVFKIKWRNHLVAELKAPDQVNKRGLAAERLLSLAQKAPTKSKRYLKISQNIDRYLYK